MKILINKLLLLFLILSMLSLNACRKGNNGPSWDVDVLAPILKTTLGIENLIPDSLIQTNPDSSLTIVFDNTIFRLSLDTLVTLPDTTVKERFDLPFGSFYLQPGQGIPTLNNITNETKYNLKTVELVEAKIRSGFVSFEIASSIGEMTVVNFTMPGFIKQSVPFSVSTQVAAGSISNPATAYLKYNLTGYNVDLRGAQGIDFNTILANLSVIIDVAAPDSVLVSTGDYFEIKYNLEDIITDYAKGYFGQYNISMNQQIDTMDFFKNITSGFFDMESITMQLSIENGFGMDAQIVIDTLNSINSSTGTNVLLNHAFIGTSINLTRASQIPSPGYRFTYSKYDLNVSSSNSNVAEFIENLPDLLGHSYDITINPWGNNSNGNDFLYYESDFKVNLNLELPVSFSANALTIEDTVLFAASPSENGAESNINGGFLRLYVDNGFPYEAYVQIYLYDNNYNFTDSLISNQGNKVTAAPVDIWLRVTNKVLSRIDIPLNQNKVDNILAAKEALIKVRFSTIPGNQILKIYTDYEIDLKLVGDFTYRINGN